MIEVWLAPNRRVLVLGMVLPGLGTLAGAALWLEGWRVLGLALMLVGGLLVASLAWQLFRPRIRYRRGELLFYLQNREPIAVPIEIVEAASCSARGPLTAGRTPSLGISAHRGGATVGKSH